jgi:hypothetical protein
MLKRWLNTDKISLGLILGVIIPVPFALLFAAILRLIQTNFHMLSRVRDADMLLLGLAINLMVMRYYLVKLKFEKTGKALLVLTVFMILMFFIFLKNSNFVLPF